MKVPLNLFEVMLHRELTGSGLKVVVLATSLEQAKELAQATHPEFKVTWSNPV